MANYPRKPAKAPTVVQAGLIQLAKEQALLGSETIKLIEQMRELSDCALRLLLLAGQQPVEPKNQGGKIIPFSRPTRLSSGAGRKRHSRTTLA